MRRKENARDDADRWSRFANDFADYSGQQDYDRHFGGVISGSLSAEYGLSAAGVYPPEGHDYPHADGR